MYGLKSCNNITLLRKRCALWRKCSHLSFIEYRYVFPFWIIAQVRKGQSARARSWNPSSASSDDEQPHRRLGNIFYVLHSLWNLIGFQWSDYSTNCTHIIAILNCLLMRELQFLSAWQPIRITYITQVTNQIQ